jgi:hypothetical protein
VPTRSWWRRSVRLLGLDGNPMRRTVDRFETAVRIALLTAFLVVAPPIAAHVAHHAEAAGLRAEHEQAPRHRVTATLLRDAPPPVGHFNTTATEPLVKARWTMPDGTLRTGDIRSPWNQDSGSTVAIWTDDAGLPVDPPLSHSDLVGQAVTAATMALAILAIAVLVIHQIARRILDRRRMADWEADWSAIEPQWTGRRPHR